VSPKGVESCAAVSLALILSLAAAQQVKSQALEPAPPLASPARPLPQTEWRSSPSINLPPEPEELRGALPAAAGPPSSVSSNYGAPRPKIRLPKPNPPLRAHAGAPPRRKNPLPPLEAYKTSAVARRALRMRPPRDAPKEEIPTTVAVTPTIKTKPKPKVEANPYDPVGIGVGSLRLSPFLETSAGHDSNPDRLASGGYPTPKGSMLLRADAGLKLRTDWARDDFVGNMRLGYVDYVNYERASRPDGVGNFVGRYDVTRDTAIDVLGRFTLDTQRPGAPALSSGLPFVTVVNRPIIFSAGASAGVTQKFNRLELSLRGSFDRWIYQNAFYNDGSALNLASTDYNDYGVSGRAAYEVSPSLKPFLEGTYDSRVHDSPVDPFGFYRDSVGFSARGGAKVKITDLLNGEASGGYAQRDYRDPRLPMLHGTTIDGALVYTPTPLTTVTLRGSTTLNETTLQGASGALTRTINAELTHDLLRNLRLTALGSAYVNDYQGASLVERGYTAGVKLEYKITRSITLKASYSHERLTSNQQGDNYTADVVMLGLRIMP
jgi:hypothetical protein